VDTQRALLGRRGIFFQSLSNTISGLKCTKNAFADGALPHTQLGTHSALPLQDALARFRGWGLYGMKGREREGIERRKRKGKGEGEGLA